MMWVVAFASFDCFLDDVFNRSTVRSSIFTGFRNRLPAIFSRSVFSSHNSWADCAGHTEMLQRNEGCLALRGVPPVPADPAAVDLQFAGLAGYHQCSLAAAFGAICYAVPRSHLLILM